MVIDRDALEEGKLPQLRLRAAPCDPPFEHTTAEQVFDPPHRDRPLLFLGLVVVRGNERPVAAAAGAEERALLHQPEQPVPRRKVVAVQNPAQRGEVEGRRLLGELGRVIMEARGEREWGCRGGRGAVQMASDDGNVAGGGGLGIHVDDR